MKTITYTYDELHAFSKHVAMCEMEREQLPMKLQLLSVDDNLQSFIDKTLDRWYANEEHITLILNQKDRDVLSDLLDTDLNSWIEFYRHENEELAQLENYTCFKLLKQMKYDISNEEEIITKAKSKIKKEQNL